MAVPFVLVLVLLFVSLFVILRSSRQQPSPAVTNDRLQSMGQQELQDEKLRQEILKLQT